MANNLIQSFDVNSYVGEYVTHKLFDIALIGLRNAVGRINKENKKIKIERFSSEDCIEYIAQHLQENIRWATNISFRDSNKAKNINDVFIELDLYIKPLKLRLEQQETIPEIPISEIFSGSDKNVILLGQPGAGKTTSVKKLFLELLYRDHEAYKVFNFPLVIRLKDLTKNSDTHGLILLKEVLNAIGVFYVFEGNVDKKYQEKILIHIFKDFVERLDILLILDGFDEISDNELKDEVIIVPFPKGATKKK